MAEIISKGIDVSYAQGKIDWGKLKGKIDFAILRCGYGGDYPLQDDLQFISNVKGCEENGIPYGVYLYSYATTPEKAKSEAEHTLRLLKGRVPQLPVFYDLEESRISTLGKSKILEIAKNFCYEIEKAGYEYGTYANKNWYENYLTDKWYDSKVKWLAQYNNEVTYKGKYDLWQFTSSGRIDGIAGNVDMNYCYASILKGDVNNDGKVTAADARKILRVSSQLDNTAGQSAINADVNNDGKITASDARQTLQKASGVN